MANRSQGWVKCEDRLPYYRDSSCSLPLPRLHDHNSTTREDLAAGAGAPGAQGPLEWGSWGFNAARGRCSGQLRSKKMSHASRLWTKYKALSTKHLELLVRATLKSVIGLCGLIASRPFSAPPTCNLQPDDRQLRFFFRRCSYSTILRGWPCQPRIPAGRPPCPTAPFSTYSYLLIAHHHPSRPPLTV